MEENIRTYGGQNTSLQCKLLIPCTNVHMNFLFEMMAAAPRVAAYIAAAPAYKSSGSKRISTTNNIFTAGSCSGSQHMAFLQSHEYAHHWVKVVHTPLCRNFTRKQETENHDPKMGYYILHICFSPYRLMNWQRNPWKIFISCTAAASCKLFKCTDCF